MVPGIRFARFMGMWKLTLIGFVIFLASCMAASDWGEGPGPTPGSDGRGGEGDDDPGEDEPLTRPVDGEDEPSSDLPDPDDPNPDDPNPDDPNPDDPPPDDRPTSVPSGRSCSCDGDCAGTATHDPMCIHGICGARATNDVCQAGSTAPCPTGHRCWSGTGRGICYPDYVAGECEGIRDSDGSCVSDGSTDCYEGCGIACDIPGLPPGVDDLVPDDTPNEPCGGLDYYGECAGDVARWCGDGVIREEDCGARGQVCDWVNDSIGYYCTGGTGPEPPVDPGDGCSDPVVQEVVALVNEARSSNGLSPLTCDNGLTQAAYLHSLDMCERNYFSHTSLDGRSHTDRIAAQGVSFTTSGENIAWGQMTADEVHTTWMNSWGHRANILGRSYGRIGVGYEPCSGRPLWTQNFTD